MARRVGGRRALGLLLLWLAAMMPQMVRADALTFPPLTGRVVDTANLLQPDQAAALSDKLKGIETTTGHQVVIATLNDLQGDDIADYSYQLGRAWRIGGKGTNDGLVIVVVPSAHKLWITTGYGLEPIVTDAMASLIIHDKITPLFKTGDFAGGLNAGVDALADLLKLPPDEAVARSKALVNARKAAQAQEAKTSNIIRWLPWILFAVFFVLPMLFGRRRGVGYVPMFIPMGGFGGGGYSSGTSFGGGGDDSFSGGGGSFGGGGAGGSW